MLIHPQAVVRRLRPEHVETKGLPCRKGPWVLALRVYSSQVGGGVSTVRWAGPRLRHTPDWWCLSPQTARWTVRSGAQVLVSILIDYYVFWVSILSSRTHHQEKLKTFLETSLNVPELASLRASLDVGESKINYTLCTWSGFSVSAAGFLLSVDGISPSDYSFARHGSSYLRLGGDCSCYPPKEGAISSMATMHIDSWHWFKESRCPGCCFIQLSHVSRGVLIGQLLHT